MPLSLESPPMGRDRGRNRLCDFLDGTFYVYGLRWCLRKLNRVLQASAPESSSPPSAVRLGLLDMYP